ncbi:hypothetical protein G6F70_008476 [Rhizopus microsporus]|uniref:Ribosomal RNA adenine dimethylase domain-containing protein 1 n=3 Tax=Rhizopus TaxID=4842 RepID=A0A367JT89_RHIAZ|nr:hypothetical protein G6F71_000592 [Rhizopus microsporus]RCH93069.1 Ribosomal RNA adenine dimethylase domain-containing protein 1 [Rhizopus azygosporus]KAG1195121.1 hypothetical protein G6F70_008476 [Rhizopus microsporus]KAG1206974.1 hypothetical protein G6F69_008422 [Rhizopus microsporus]KAG1233831.1 hypothetical protein G6F67_004000 [Rhizopus microsporus]
MSSFYIRLPEKYKNKSVQEYLDDLLEFYNEYFWLIHVLPFNFITHRQWDQFDVEWRNALMSFMEQAGDNWAKALLESILNTNDYSIWPESLRNYIEKTRDLSLPRNEEPFQNNQANISKQILGGMSDKKIHEVELMGQLIKQVANERGITSVIDLGSGQGYLSRALAFDHGFDVVAVDMSEIQTKGAIRFDEKAKKQARDKSEMSIRHVTEKVTPENVSQVLASTGLDGNKKWLVTGLHTCGDLSPTIFRLFTESDKISCMVNVGCCYNALTPSGFPMSSLLREKKMELKSTARVLACHSPSRWLEGEPCIEAFDNYFFRALLQEMLVERELSDINDPPILGRIKQNKEFTSFVAASLKRLKLPPDTITEQEARDHYLKAKEKQADKQFVTLWTLRALLASIVESIILVDRWLYLEESVSSLENSQHKGVWAYPLFDQVASPRNVVYVASK